MNRFLNTALLFAALLHPISAQDAEPKAPAAAKEKPFPMNVLEQALNNMARLNGYHIHAEITTPGGKATLDGDLGVGTLSFIGDDGRGNKRLRIVADRKFFLSLDGGATWKTGADADKQGTMLLSQVVTGPVEPSLRIWDKGDFKATEEKVNDEDLLHVEKPASGREPAVHFWLVREPEMDNAIFVRKASMIVSAEDAEFPVTVTYTKLNKPGEIKAPVTE